MQHNEEKKPTQKEINDFNGTWDNETYVAEKKEDWEEAFDKQFKHVYHPNIKVENMLSDTEPIKDFIRQQRLSAQAELLKAIVDRETVLPGEVGIVYTRDILSVAKEQFGVMIDETVTGSDK